MRSEDRERPYDCVAPDLKTLGMRGQELNRWIEGSNSEYSSSSLLQPRDAARFHEPS